MENTDNDDDEEKPPGTLECYAKDSGSAGSDGTRTTTWGEKPEPGKSCSRVVET